MSTGQKSPLNTRHGGFRPNSGRKAKAINVVAIRKMLETEKKFEEENGKTLDDVLYEMSFNGKINNEPIPPNQQLAAIKLCKEYTMAPMDTAIKDDDEIPEAPIWLPEQEVDKAKVVELRPENGDLETT